MKNQSGDRVSVVSNSETYAIVPLDDAPRAGTIRFVFAEEADDDAPVSVRVRNPEGTIVLERVLRELPTRGSDLAALTVPVSGKGDYVVELRAVTTLVDRGPKRDPWELESGVRRCAQAVPRATSALLRVG